MHTHKPALLVFGILLVWAALVAAHRELDRLAAPPLGGARQAGESLRPFRRLLYPVTVVTRIFGGGAPAPEATDGTPPAALRAGPAPDAPRRPSGAVGGRGAPAPSTAAAETPVSAETAVTPAAAAPLKIATAALPPAITGTAYYAPLFAEGGTLPYRWRVSSGALPAGIELDGTHGMLRGMATVSGTAQVGVSVTDAAGQRAATAYLLAVTDGGGTPYARPQGKILPSLTFADMFEDELPTLVAPDAS